MSLKRTDQNDTDEYAINATVLAEAGRTTADGSRPVKADEEKMSLFWRVFGGTILSIVALIGVTMYNSMAGGITELRGEVNRLNEARADWVKKDEFNSRIATNYERVQALQVQNTAQNATLTSHKTELDAVKERLVRQAADQDAARKDFAAALDAIKKDVAAIEGMKEKLATVSLELKALRDDTTKLRQETDRNTAYDAERKAFRDRQSEQFEKLMKETQAALQECQVKLARVEAVQQQPMKPAAKTTPKEKPSTPEKIGAPKEGKE